MPAKGNKHCGYLLDDPRSKRWYENVAESEQEILLAMAKIGEENVKTSDIGRKTHKDSQSMMASQQTGRQEPHLQDEEGMVQFCPASLQGVPSPETKQNFTDSCLDSSSNTCR